MAVARTAISRFVSWPVFTVLAVVHIGVLPFLLSEREDDVVSLLAGTAYATFAALDLMIRRRRTPGPG